MTHLQVFFRKSLS